MLNNREFINEQLNSNPGIIGCLVNCSSNGVCQQNMQTLKLNCKCDSHFSGVKCDIDLRPCALHPCMNSAKCIDTLTATNGTRFTCACTENYYGHFCEQKIDICKNESCSMNGYCTDKNNVPTCECYSLYSGMKCETKSDKLVVITASKKICSIAAIISICLVGVTVIILDLDCCGIKKKAAKKREKSQKEADSFQKGHVYVNFKSWIVQKINSNKKLLITICSEKKLPVIDIQIWDSLIKAVSCFSRKKSPKWNMWVKFIRKPFSDFSCEILEF